MWAKAKSKSVLIGVLVVLILVALIDLFLMLFGGEYLAAMATPSLPGDLTHTGNHFCASGSSIRCVGKSYLTSYSPEMVVSGWNPDNYSLEHDSFGIEFYEYEACNENILGRQYAFLHEDRPLNGEPCTRIVVMSDKSGMTRIDIGLVTTKCLSIINAAYAKGYIDYWSRLNSWCNDG